MTLQSERLGSSQDYQREAEHTRRRLAESLDELSDRLTPGQVFDEVLTYSRSGGGMFLRALTNAMRENPVPSLLVGAGCMMFLSEKMGLSRLRGNETRSETPVMGSRREAFSQSHSRPSQAGSAFDSAASGARSAAASAQAGVRGVADFVSGQAGNVTNGVRQGAASVGDTMRQTAATVGDTLRQGAGTVTDAMRQGGATASDAAAGAVDAVRSTTHDLRDSAAAAAEQARSGAQSLVGTVGNYSSSVGGQIVDSAHRTRRQASEALRQGRESAASFITEQPLLCVAVGVAVGAAIASMIPKTSAEDEWLGESSDAVKDAAGQVAAEQMEGAKTIAAKAAMRARDAAQDAIREEGFTPEAVAEAAHNLTEGIGRGLAGSASGATSQPQSASQTQSGSPAQPASPAREAEKRG